MISQELTRAKLALYSELLKVIKPDSKRDCDIELGYQLSKDPDVQEHLTACFEAEKRRKL
jgi:hypothetical protein